MRSAPRTVRRATALAVALAALLALPSAGRAQQWTDGSASMVPHLCTLPVMGTLPEQLVWTWVGYTQPATVGQVYWMHIVIGSLGCSGIYAVPEVRLPPSTTFAVDAAHQITCIYTDPRGAAHTIVGGECPSTPGAQLYPYLGGFANLGNTSGYIYGLAAGTTLEIRFPVITSAPLSGMASNAFLMGAVNVQDLNTGSVFWDGPSGPYNGGLPSPGPSEGVFVFAAGAAARPTIRYVEPTLVSVTATTAVTAAEITSAGCGAEVHYELYPADGSTDTTFFDAATTRCAFNSSAPFTCALGWGGLIGGKTYKWRVFDWVPNAGQPAACARANVIGLPTGATDGWRYFTAPDAARPITYSLVASGTNGTVGLAPAGGAYAAGSTVTVTATPAAGFHLSGWLLDGVAAGTANPLQVTMNAAHALVAQFSPTTYVIKASSAGTGTISLAPSQASYAPGAKVSATPVPGKGMSFMGWTLDGVDQGMASPLTLTMDRDHTLVAGFEPTPAGFQVTTVIAPGGGTGTISLSPAGGFYASGTSVTATATPDAGSTFQAWLLNGHEVAARNTYALRVTADTTLTAVFQAPVAPGRSVTTSVVGAGTVAISPPGGTYQDGASLTVTATPATGQRFAGWRINGAPGAPPDNPLSLTVSGDMTVEATFAPEVAGGGGGGGGGGSPGGGGGGCSTGAAGALALLATPLLRLVRRRAGAR